MTTTVSQSSLIPESPIKPVPPIRWVYLDVLRCVAILMVLGPHTPFRLPENAVGWRFFETWRHGGWVGVDLFFVLSGFLIGGLLFSEERKYGSIRFGRFFIRRTFKIWPTYLVYLAAIFVLVVHDVPDRSVPLLPRIRHAAGAIWPYLIHIQNYKELELIERIGHTWSLAVEEHFYLLLPLLLFTLGSQRKGADRQTVFASVPWIGVGLLIVCLALRINSWRGHPEFDEFRNHWPTHLRIDALFTGVVLAYGVHFARPMIESLRRWRWIILAVSIACFVPFAWVDGKGQGPCTYGYTALSIGSVGLVLAAWFTSVPAPGMPATPVWLPQATPPPVLKAVDWTARMLALIGARSYSIYLFHMPFSTPLTMKVLTRLRMWESPWHYPMAVCVYVGLALGMGAVVYFIIEAPSVAIREKLFPGRTAAK